MRPTQSQPLVASAVGTIRQPMDRLCYVDPIVILAIKGKLCTVDPIVIRLFKHQCSDIHTRIL